MRESEVEKKLIDEVKKRGGLCEKWVSGTVGWPDRIVFLPDGKVGFVEVKRPGEKPHCRDGSAGKYQGGPVCR